MFLISGRVRTGHSGTMLLYLLLYLLGSCGVSSAVWLQRPVDNEEKEEVVSHPFQKYNKPSLFHDSRFLRENVETSVFVFKENIKRVYFLLERTHSSILFTVTPCSAPVEWRILLKTLNRQTNIRSMDNISRFLDDAKEVPSSLYYGSNQKSFSDLNATPGIYILEFDSDNADTSVQVYVTTDRGFRYPYPRLPANPKVEILKVRRDRVLASWKSSPSENQDEQDIEYCVAANLKKNHHTYCAVSSAIHGDIPPTPHPQFGQDSPFGKAIRKKLLKVRKEILKNLQVDKDIVVECIGRKTWHIFRNLEDNKHYYLDVFAVNTLQNTSTAYDGASVVTKVANKLRLRDNKLTTIVLDETDDFISSTKYVLKTAVPQVWLFVQSCSGPGPVRIDVAFNKTIILTSMIMDTRTLILNSPEKGTYSVRISSSVPNMRTVRILLSRKYHKYPFPTLPEDKRIKVMDTLTRCNSVTLAWRSSHDEKVKYCIFKREEQGSFMRMFAEPPENICTETQLSSRPGRVSCRRYHRFSNHRFQNVIMQKIKNLKPGSTYVFEVFVTKFRGKTLSYEKVWVTTPSTCSSTYNRGKR